MSKPNKPNQYTERVQDQKNRASERAPQVSSTDQRERSRQEKRAQRQQALEMQPRRPNTQNRDEVRRESKHKIGQPK